MHHPGANHCRLYLSHIVINILLQVVNTPFSSSPSHHYYYTYHSNYYCNHYCWYYNLPFHTNSNSVSVVNANSRCLVLAPFPPSERKLLYSLYAVWIMNNFINTIEWQSDDWKIQCVGHFSLCCPGNKPVLYNVRLTSFCVTIPKIGNAQWNPDKTIFDIYISPV